MAHRPRFLVGEATVWFHVKHQLLRTRPHRGCPGGARHTNRMQPDSALTQQLALLARCQLLTTRHRRRKAQLDINLRHQPRRGSPHHGHNPRILKFK